jgi:hypothetical protein
MFAMVGIAGIPAALLGGRLHTAARERVVMAACLAVLGGATALLLSPAIVVLVLALAAIGAANGPLNVALFSLRQRRTPRAWFGRAFAVSLSLNYAGTPIGAALAGPLVGRSLGAAIIVASALPLCAAALVWRIPR